MSWAIMAAAILAMLGGLWWRLSRARAVQDDTREQALAVYKSQLADLDRDVADGRLSRAEADAAAVEIKRRALAADKYRNDAGKPLGLPRGAGLATALLGLALGIGGYIATGQPGLPPSPKAAGGAPYASTDTKGRQSGAEERQPDLAKLVDQLAEVLKDDPDRPDGWAMMGRSTARLGQWERSASAYERATALAPDNADYWIAYGEALMRVGEGQMTPAARLAFTRAGKIEPRHPAVAYYTGVALQQQGRTDDAVALWRDALDRLPEEAQRARAPFRTAIVRAQADAARQNAPSATMGGGMPQPGQEAMAAAGDMSESERQAFINSMVERLAGRLEANPDDRDGWLRLARARTVLGDTEAARQALQRALALTEAEAEKAQIRQQLQNLETAGENQ